jgi:hypothetical protein
MNTHHDEIRLLFVRPLQQPPVAAPFHDCGFDRAVGPSLLGNQAAQALQRIRT